MIDLKVAKQVIKADRDITDRAKSAPNKSSPRWKAYLRPILGLAVLSLILAFLIPVMIKKEINYAGDNLVPIANFKPGDLIDGSTGTDTIDFSAEKNDGYVIHIFDGKLYKMSDLEQENVIMILNVENIIGTDQDDDLNGGVYANVIDGRGGNDIIRGNGDVDIIYGGDGNDNINGGYRIDRLFGQAGDDIFSVTTISGGDDIDGGLGMDTVDYANFTHSGITIDLTEQNIREHKDRDLGPYSIINVEHIIGSPFNDIIMGDDGPNRLTGGIGSDEIDGRGGEDVAVYLGEKANYDLKINEDGKWAVTSLTDAASIDILSNIEYIEFSDERVRLTR